MHRRRRIIANEYEAAVHATLNEVAEKSSCTAFPKVRVADALYIDHSGLDNDAYSYALNAHFDFLVVDSQSLPKFAVEFDGPSHESLEGRRKDVLKNSICEKLGLPLLRVTSEYLEEENESMSLLAWLIDVYFIFEAFLDAQSQGGIPPDEPFGYAFSSFDYFSRYRALLWAAYRDGKLRSPPIAHIYTLDLATSQYVAGHFLELKDGSFIVGEASCKRNELYPIDGDELAPELAMVDAVKKLVRAQYANYQPVDRAQARARYMEYAEIINRNGLKYGFGSGTFPSET